jgi:hypothetical protein
MQSKSPLNAGYLKDIFERGGFSTADLTKYGVRSRVCLVSVSYMSPDTLFKNLLSGSGMLDRIRLSM